MKAIVVGIANQRTTLPIGAFPVMGDCDPSYHHEIRYSVGGMAFSIARSLAALGNEVDLAAPLGEDYPTSLIDNEAYRFDLSTHLCTRTLTRTPRSVVLYADDGTRQVFNDLTDASGARFHIDDLLPDIADADVTILASRRMTSDLAAELCVARLPFAVDLHDVRAPGPNGLSASGDELASGSDRLASRADGLASGSDRLASRADGLASGSDRLASRVERHAPSTDADRHGGFGSSATGSGHTGPGIGIGDDRFEDWVGPFLAARYLLMSGERVPGREAEVLLAYARASKSELAVMTLAEDGCLLLARKEDGTWPTEPVHVPGSPVRITNTIGAGDAFLAVFLHETISCGADPITAASRANTAVARLLAAEPTHGGIGVDRLAELLGPACSPRVDPRTMLDAHATIVEA